MTVVNSENKPIENTNQENVAAQVQQSAPEVKKPIEEDPNWRAFREGRKKDREEKEAADRRASEAEKEAAALKAAMEAAFSREARTSSSRADTNNQSYASDDESEDERIEKKVQAAIRAREEAAERNRNEREQQEYPQRLTQHYPDFNQTVMADNLDYLEYHYPEVAAPLKMLPDGYDKWAHIYKAVKKFVPNSTTAKREASKADANFNKPKSMSSTGVSQSGESQGSSRLSDERKQQNWERMQKMLKSVG